MAGSTVKSPGKWSFLGESPIQPRTLLQTDRKMVFLPRRQAEIVSNFMEDSG